MRPGAEQRQISSSPPLPLSLSALSLLSPTHQPPTHPHPTPTNRQPCNRASCYLVVGEYNFRNRSVGRVDTSWGPFIKDVCKIFGIFDPLLPPSPHFTQPISTVCPQNLEISQPPSPLRPPMWTSFMNGPLSFSAPMPDDVGNSHSPLRNNRRSFSPFAKLSGTAIFQSMTHAVTRYRLPPPPPAP